MWLLPQASHLPRVSKCRDSDRAAAWRRRWPQRCSHHPPAALQRDKTEDGQWAEHKNVLEEGCSKLSETCTKICRKLLLLQVALNAAWCPAWVTELEQGLDGGSSAGSVAVGGCKQQAARGGLSFWEAGASRSVLLGIHVLKGWRKPWLLTSELKRTDSCQQKALGSGWDLLPRALRNLHRPLLKPGRVPGCLVPSWLFRQREGAERKT